MRPMPIQPIRGLFCAIAISPYFRTGRMRRSLARIPLGSTHSSRVLGVLPPPWGEGLGVGVVVIALSMCSGTPLARRVHFNGLALAHRDSLCRHGWVSAG